MTRRCLACSPRVALAGLACAALTFLGVAGCAGSDSADDQSDMLGGTSGVVPTGSEPLPNGPGDPNATNTPSPGNDSPGVPSPGNDNPDPPTPAGGGDGGASGGPANGGAPGDDGEGGSDVSGAGGSELTGTGGAPDGAGGTPGTGIGGGFVGGGAGGESTVEPLDCGPNGTAVEEHGPTSNRLNYVIVGDGYSEQELQPGGALDQHLDAAMEKRFSDPVGQPYLRYRKFVNICVLRIPSGPICGQSEFGCCGDDGSRLANCNNGAVNDAISQNLPASFEVDWRAVVLNGSSWWNSGGTLMMWSGGNQDAGGAALHEGGHGHNFVSDEYGNCEQGRVSREATYGVNVSLTNGDTGGKWDDWIGYDQNPGTGEQGFFACDGGATWRPSSNSMMNSLFGDDPDTSYNPVSREKIVMDIWRVVESPYDYVTPEPGAVTNPSALTVGVIDPEVISVDWTLDGEAIAMDGGPTYNIGAANLAAGTYTVTARAYDNAGPDLVRQVPDTTFNRQYWGSGEMGHSDKTVSWTVTIQ